MSANTIQLDSDSFIHEEAVCDGAVNPGNIVEQTSAGKIKKHATEGGRGLIAVAVEDALQGKTVSDAYADGALASYNIQRAGTRFQGILKAGEDVAIGAGLVSDGAGRLIAIASVGSGVTVNQVLAYAEEAVDLSASGAVDTLIAVRAG